MGIRGAIMDQHLFLFGGGPPFTAEMAERFSDLCKESTAPVAIVCVDQGSWEQYMPSYTEALEKSDVRDFHFLPLPTTPVKKVVECLKESSGIIICGGNTNLYADNIVETIIGNVIIERFKQGIPVAGFSAGALISPELCLLAPSEPGESDIRVRKGLGLISNLLLSVHFSESNEESHLRNAVRQYPHYVNYGIDEDTCMYFKNGQLEEMEGKGVHTIESGVLCRVF